jgi:hypothetical protein
MNNHFYPNGEIAPGIMKLRNCKNDGEISMKDNDWCSSSLNYRLRDRLFLSQYRKFTQLEIDSETNFFYNYALAREAFYTRLLLEKFNAPVFQERVFSDKELFEFLLLSGGGSIENDDVNTSENLIKLEISFVTNLSPFDKKMLEIAYSIYLFTRNKIKYGIRQRYDFSLDSYGDFNDAHTLYY